MDNVVVVVFLFKALHRNAANYLQVLSSLLRNFRCTFSQFALGTHMWLKIYFKCLVFLMNFTLVHQLVLTECDSLLIPSMFPDKSLISTTL